MSLEYGLLLIMLGVLFSLALIIWVVRRFNSHIDYREFIYEDGKKYYFRIINSDEDYEKFLLTAYSSKFMLSDIGDKKISSINLWRVRDNLDLIMKKYKEELKDKDTKGLKDFDGFVGNVPDHIKKRHNRNGKLEQLGINKD